MKIAMLGPTPPFRGGIVQFALSLADEMSRQGHDIRLFGFIRQYPSCLFPGGSQTAEYSPDIHLPLERVFTPYQPWTWHQAVKRIRSWQPDQVIISYWLPFMALAMGWISRRLGNTGIKYLVHNIKFHERWLFADRLSRYALSPAERIILLSQSSYDDLLRLHPQIGADRLVRGFHPVYDTYLRSEAKNISAAMNEDKDRPPTLLFFGLIKPYKGLDILIRAFAIARRRLPQILLAIVGDVYGDKSEYSDLISGLGLDAAVKTHFSYVADSEVGSFFRRADVCILPYRSATQSGIVQLSYAFEVPVIASRVGGIGEYVRDNETGFLVPPEDPEALADAICSFVERADRAKMRQSIREFNAEHGWNKLAKLVLGED